MFDQIQNRTRAEVSPLPKLSDETFLKLRDFIYQKTGIYFPEKKKYLIEGRLVKRLQLLQIAHFEEYLQLLKYGSHIHTEFEFLCNTVTINETFFFRNDSQIEAIQQRIAQEVIEGKSEYGKRTLRIWSAACSSGEEPYTLAMLFLETIKPRYSNLRVEIIGTDINTSVLEMALRGEYRRYAVRTIPESYLKKYFTHQDGLYRLNAEVKELVKFEHQNLIDHAKMREMTNFDLIFCANVLIYFSQQIKIQVVGDLYNSLNRGGYLFIGSSEMLHGISTAFKLVSLPKTTAYKKE